MNANSSNSNAAGVARELSQALSSGGSLGTALEAAADGCRSRRLARALRKLAERVNRGEPLEHILQTNSPLPPFLSGVMRAGLATGHPALSIAEWLFLRERVHSQWREVLGAIAYPLAMLGATYALFLVLNFAVLPGLKEGLAELNFQQQLPPSTERVWWCMDHLPRISLEVLGIVAVGLGLVRLIGGRVAWSKLMWSLPLLGSLWHWGGSSELLRALALMLDHHIPLPQALTLTGDGISDAALARHCQQLSESVDQGMELSRSMQKNPVLPPSIVPIVRSGERAGNVSDALRGAAEMLDARLQALSSLVLLVAPTVIFFLIVGLALALVVGFALPLISFIRIWM